MDREQIQEWLARRITSERRNQLGFASLGAISGIAVTGLTAALGTKVLFLAIHQVIEIGRAFGYWKLTFEAKPLNLVCIAVSFMALQLAGLRSVDDDYIFYLPKVDWRSSENIGAVIGIIWAVTLDIVYSGPRLLAFTRERLCLRRELHDLDQSICAGVLEVIHRRDRRVAFTDLERKVPGFSEALHVGQMMLIKGVLHLPSDPPGLSINSELKKEFGGAPRHQRVDVDSDPEPSPQPDQRTTNEKNKSHTESRHSAKPPAFRCAGCRRKFRLRNLQGGVDFNCPLCGEAYRTIADSKGRVRVEKKADEFDPSIDIDFSNETAQAFLILGLPPDADRDEVKKAYRRLMKEFHPDKAANMSPADRRHFEERSKEINRAYGEILDALK